MNSSNIKKTGQISFKDRIKKHATNIQNSNAILDQIKANIDKIKASGGHAEEDDFGPQHGQHQNPAAFAASSQTSPNVE